MNLAVILATAAAAVLAAVVLSSFVSPSESPDRHLSQAERVALFQRKPIVLLGPSSHRLVERRRT